jgi:hypothetical protein
MRGNVEALVNETTMRKAWQEFRDQHEMDCAGVDDPWKPREPNP